MATLDRYLQIECTYRLNVDFSVEDIETLLSSRFIDEDFFKPTMARYQSQNQAESLPSSAIPFLPPSSLSTTKPINYTRPSYGSLPSRNLIPPPPQQTTISTSPNIDINRSIPIRPTLISSPSAPVPVRAESLSSGGRGAGGNRYGSYGASGGIEPAFVTLSRARAASNVGFISGGSGSGIQRASVSLDNFNLTTEYLLTLSLCYNRDYHLHLLLILIIEDHHLALQCLLHLFSEQVLTYLQIHQLVFQLLHLLQLPLDQLQI